VECKCARIPQLQKSYFLRLYLNSNPQLKNLSLINKNFTSSYILKPGGSTYKFKNVLRNFSVKTNLRDRYNQFERKSAREVTVEGRLIEMLIEKIRSNDAHLMNLYNNPRLLKNLFSLECLRDIEEIISNYNLLVTKIIIVFLKKGIRMTQKNLPNDIVKLQCLLMESFSIGVYAVNYIKVSPGGNIAGIDFVRFRKKSEFLKAIQYSKFKNPRYAFSSKNIKVKKDLPKLILDNFAEDSKLAKLKAYEFNLKLQIDLIKKVIF
jgi:hypothetical protein